MHNVYIFANEDEDNGEGGRYWHAVLTFPVNGPVKVMTLDEFHDGNVGVVLNDVETSVATIRQYIDSAHRAYKPFWQDPGASLVGVSPGYLGNVNGPGCDPDTV